MALFRDGLESLLKDITLGCIHKITLSKSYRSFVRTRGIFMPIGIKYSLNKYFPLPLGGIGKHFNTDIPTVAIPGGSAMMIKYVFVLIWI